MKCTLATVTRIARDCFADIGRYHYRLTPQPLGRDTITRRPITGGRWETVATYDPERDAWTISK